MSQKEFILRMLGVLFCIIAFLVGAGVVLLAIIGVMTERIIGGFGLMAIAMFCLNQLKP